MDVWETDINALHWRNDSLGPFSQPAEHKQRGVSTEPQAAGLLMAHAEGEGQFNKVNERQTTHGSVFHPTNPLHYLIYAIVLHLFLEHHPKPGFSTSLISPWSRLC